MIGIFLAIVGGTIISNVISPDLQDSLLSEQLKLFKNIVLLESQITISLNKMGLQTKLQLSMGYVRKLLFLLIKLI